MAGYPYSLVIARLGWDTALYVLTLAGTAVTALLVRKSLALRPSLGPPRARSFIAETKRH